MEAQPLFHDATPLFKGTPLEQDVFQLVRPLHEFDYEGAYQPGRIMSWNFAYEDIGIERAMFLHEVCHIIEIWCRKKPQRLLMQGFGYTEHSITLKGVQTEAWVLALEAMMEVDLYGEAIRNYLNPLVRQTFASRGCELEEQDWMAMISRYTAEHEARGLQYYYESWQNAAAYVRLHAYVAPLDLSKTRLL